MRRDNCCHTATVRSLEQAQAHLARGEWRAALDLCDQVNLGASDGAGGGAGGPGGPDGDALLAVRAAAAYGAGDLEGAVTAWEDVHAARVARGDREGAADAACRVALHLLCDTGLMSPVRGWTDRAARLLDPGREQAAAAMVATVRGYERFLSGDHAGAERQATLAVDLGNRLGVLPAVVIGRTALGRLRILAGEVAGGLALLDEVAAQLMSGEADAFTTGIMYCEIICAAQSLGEHDRAREWTDLMHRWGQGAAFGAIHGRCRVHRAELLRLSGPGAEAEAQATRAADELRPWLRREFGWPLVELGTIRLLRGDLPGAEEALLEAHRQVWSPQPALALLRLAQGQVRIALAMIDDAVQRPADNPSKEQPPFGGLRLAPLLGAQVRIAAAAGEVEVAAVASAALDRVVARYGGAALTAGGDLARGRVALLRGESARAVAACTAAVQAWVELGAPYEAAAARMVLGAAHAQAGRPEAARLEWEAARDGFDAFGAVLGVAEAARLLERRPEGTTSRPVPAAAAVAPVVRAAFVRVGDCRRIAYGGSDVLLHDLKGFRYLARLLAEPGRELHVLDLVSLEGPAPGRDGADRTGRESGELVARRGADLGLAVLDDQARAAYRRRVLEVDEDIEEAARDHDLARLELAERDRDFLLAELGRSVGLGGRERRTGGTTERARTSVTRSVRYALGRLAEVQPELGGHLDRHVRTGTYCSYVPDPTAPLVWEVTGT